MIRLRNLGILILWFVLGAVLSEAEFFLWGVINKFHVLDDSFLTIIPIMLFMIINYHNKVLIAEEKEISHYFMKSVVFIYAGWMLRYYYNLYYHDDSLGVLLATITATALIVILVCMKIIQMLYVKIPHHNIYFRYIILGSIMAFNVSYIMGEYQFIEFCSPHVVAHTMLLISVIIWIIYDYKKHHRIKIETNEIKKQDYRNNALKMTVISLLLLVLPLYTIFDCI